MLNVSIISVRIYFRLLGLTVLSVGLHPTLSCQNLSQTTVNITVSDELNQSIYTRDLPCYTAREGLER